MRTPDKRKIFLLFFIILTLTTGIPINKKFPIMSRYNNVSILYQGIKMHVNFPRNTILKSLWNQIKLKEVKTTIIKIVQYNTGEYSEVIVKKNASSIVKKTSMTLRCCMHEQGKLLYPLHIAHIYIVRNTKVVFQGWIFSQLPSIILPNHSGYFFYLSENTQ